MEWQLNIPKILHLYWGGNKMNYLRFMTIKTFMKHNPDWEIKFYYPKYPFDYMTWETHEQKYKVAFGSDFLSEVMELPITKVEIDFENYGLDNDISEVYKSDFIRLILLSSEGGLWSDMDIIYFRPMNDLYFNIPENKDIETFVCSNNRYGHSVGFIMGSKENKFFKELFRLSRQHFNPHNYQSIGADLYNKYFGSIESITNITPAMNISMDVVYPVDAQHISDLIDKSEMNYTDKTIGQHWYGGSSLWKPFLIKTYGGQGNLPDSIIGKLIKNEGGR